MKLSVNFLNLVFFNVSISSRKYSFLNSTGPQGLFWSGNDIVWLLKYTFPCSSLPQRRNAIPLHGEEFSISTIFLQRRAIGNLVAHPHSIIFFATGLQYSALKTVMLTRDAQSISRNFILSIHHKFYYFGGIRPDIRGISRLIVPVEILQRRMPVCITYAGIASVSAHCISDIETRTPCR